MHLNSELLFRKHAIDSFSDNLKILEIGPSGVPSVYQKVVNNPTLQWDTLDLYNAHPGITYVSQNEYQYPISDSAYDIIVCGQVMEHVKMIWAWLKELKRLVKEGGKIILINPISWPYHEFPVDCWRIFPEGMRALAEYNDLEVIHSEFESLEANAFAETKTPTIPGQSYTFIDLRKRIALIKTWNSFIHYLPVIKKLKIPVEVAYDTLTIYRKRK